VNVTNLLRAGGGQKEDEMVLRSNFTVGTERTKLSNGREYFTLRLPFRDYKGRNNYITFRLSDFDYCRVLEKLTKDPDGNHDCKAMERFFKSLMA
jgi:hypothetical protein